MQQKLTSDLSTLVQTLFSALPKNGGEISKAALTKLYALKQGIQEDSIDIAPLINAINYEGKLPKRLYIRMRRGHRDYFIRLLPSTRRKLARLFCN